MGLFFKKALQKRLHSAKETCNLKEPTNHGHPKSIIVRLKMHPTRHPNSFSLLQRIATHRSTLQHTHPAHCNTLSHQTYKHFFVTAAHSNTLQHTATHCNTLQHTATHCNTLQHTATHFHTRLPNTFSTPWHCLVQARDQCITYYTSHVRSHVT